MDGHGRRPQSFRPPPRTQIPPRPMFPQPGGHWMNAPPRMQGPYEGPSSAYPASGWAQMQGALDAITPTYHDSERVPQGIPSPNMYGLAGILPSPQVTPYPLFQPSQPRVMPRFQQYHPGMDAVFPLQQIERQFPPQHSYQQFSTSPFTHQHPHSQSTYSNEPYVGQQNGPSFMHVGNGQYQTNDSGTQGPPGAYHVPAPNMPKQGYQHWES